MNSAPAPVEPRWSSQATVVGVVFAIGAAIAIAGVLVFADQLLLQAGCVVAGLIVSGASLVQALRRRPLSESEIEQGRGELDRERRDVRRQERQIRKQLEAWTTRLEKREKQLAERLMTYHEWTEFPLPDADAAVLVEDPLAIAKDAELERLLEEESRMLLDKLTANYFAPAGTTSRGFCSGSFTFTSPTRRNRCSKRAWPISAARRAGSVCICWCCSTSCRST
jgi:hypothetical protein